MSKIEIIARGVSIKDGRVLACRNDATGYYYLPGGHVEFGESATGALRREFREECDLDVTPGSLALVTEGAFTSDKRHHEINLAFHVELPDSVESVSSAEQGISFHWLDLAALSDVDLRPSSIRAWLISGGEGTNWASDFPSKVG